MATNAPLNRRLRMGLIGGGGGFIGRVHAAAATLDLRAELVAGALSSDPARARAAATDFCIAPERAYGSYHELLAAESARAPGDRVDFVSIATPNHTHFDIARDCLAAGFHIVCDKPMTFDLAQAEELTRLVERSEVVFAVTHNYTGYPLVRQACDMIRSGELGEIQAVRISYLQATLLRQRTPEQQQRFAWKTDPARTGASGCFGDIGIHAYNLGRFITGLQPARVSCRLETFMPSGRLDDYGSAVVEFENGALGTVTASRISPGRENDLRIEVDGTRAALEWRQEEPNRLLVRTNGNPHRLYTRDPNAQYASAAARMSCRLPAGHPEGFFEAFANVYTAAFDDMILRSAGRPRRTAETLYPNVRDGLDGMNFVAQCVASSRHGGAWMSLKHPDLAERLSM